MSYAAELFLDADLQLGMDRRRSAISADAEIAS
jgi:hypothetical protein